MILSSSINTYVFVVFFFYCPLCECNFLYNGLVPKACYILIGNHIILLSRVFSSRTSITLSWRTLFLSLPESGRYSDDNKSEFITDRV